MDTISRKLLTKALENIDEARSHLIDLEMGSETLEKAGLISRHIARVEMAEDAVVSALRQSGEQGFHHMR